MIRINLERCTGCGACVEVCSTGAIQPTADEAGSHAEIDEELCQECEACVSACPEEAILMEVEPTIEGELVQVKATPVPVKAQPREVHFVRAVPKTLTWLGAALAFAGREIVPRLAASLLDAWDRRAGRSAPSSGDRVSEQPTLAENLTRKEGGQQHRQRRRGK